MRVKHLIYLAGLTLPFYTLNVFAADSTLVKKEIKPVTIGPQELDPLDLMDPLVLRNMKIDEALKARNIEVDAVKKIEQTASLKALLSGNQTSSEVDLELALEGYRRARNLQGQALIYVTYGVYYGQNNQYAKAILNFNEALKIKESLNDKTGMARMYENLSILYKASGNYEKASSCNENVIRINLSLNKLADVGFAYLELAQIKVLQQKYDDAESYIIKKCLPLFRRTANKAGRMKSFQHLANIYLSQKRLSEAKWFYLQANIMADILHDREAKIENLVNLAEVKYALGETEMAISDYKQAEILAKQQNYLSKLVRIKGDLSEIYRDIGNYTDAGAELAEYSRLSTDLFKTTNL